MVIVIMNSKRNSKKRDAILRLIQSTSSHPSAQWVYDRLKPQFPDLSLGTVYRNISFFKKEGLVSFLGVVDGEERFDGFPAPHSHAICVRCGQIMDLNESVSLNVLDPIPKEINGFTIDLRKTVFYGLCRACKPA